MENLRQLFMSDAYPWLWEVFVTVLLTLLAALLARVVLARLERRAALTRNLWDDALLRAVKQPVILLIWLLGANIVLEIIGESSDAAIFDMASDAREVLVAVLVTWFLVRLVLEIEQRLVDEHDGDVDVTTVHAIGKLVRVAVVITGALVVMQSLGYSISGVLAFGGIGGIAVGFAAKDMLANFFGGLMVYLDRPFAVGDWIRSPDKNIEGTVEEIGWRQTRIRTFDKRPLYVPNATFTQISVENPSRMLNRRIYETIGVRYSDARQVGTIVEDVKAMLKGHEAIDTDQTLIVNFNGFGPSSLDFFIYTFTKTTNWVEFHVIKQDVLLRVLEIIHGHDADVAFPTRTLHIETGEPPAAAG